MTLNQEKILVSSVKNYLDKKIYLGASEKNKKSIVLYNLLLESFRFALLQISEGHLNYVPQAKKIKKNLDRLKYHCPDICLHKNLVDYVLETELPNTPPSVEDTLFEVTPSPTYKVANNLEVSLFNSGYTDAEGDLINNVKIISLPTEGTLSYLGTDVAVGDIISIEDIEDLIYTHSKDAFQSDGLNYSYDGDLGVDIALLVDDGYTLQENGNGTLIYSKEIINYSENLIGEDVDGTFDSIPGLTYQTLEGNVTEGGWMNGVSSADVIVPHPIEDGGVARGCPASPQGGNFVGALANSSTVESLYTTIPVIEGAEYLVTFYQTSAGHIATLSNVGDECYWGVSLGSSTVNTPTMIFQGYGSQTWEEVEVSFIANTTGEVNLTFTSRQITGSNYLGLDNVQIREKLADIDTDIQTLIGTFIEDSFTFQVSDDNEEELYSDTQLITIN